MEDNHRWTLNETKALNEIYYYTIKHRTEGSWLKFDTEEPILVKGNAETAKVNSSAF